METNTVLLSLEDYNELRGFKEKISKGYIKDYSNFSRTYFTTKDKAIKKITDLNKELHKEISRLEFELGNKEIAKDICITDIRKMSIWQFNKWRRNG